MNVRKYKQYIVAGVAALILAGCSAGAYSVFYEDLRKAAVIESTEQQKQLAAIAANEIERYFYDIQKRMETIAVHPTVREAKRGEDCNLQLQKFVELNRQEINNLGRVNKDGMFICAVNRTIIGEPVSKYGSYFAAIANHPQHKPAMSRLILPTGSASPVVALHVPVLNDSGQFDGTIGGAVYFDELQKHILGGTQLSEGSLFSLYDSNLDVLYSPDPLIRGKNLNTPEVKRLYGSPSDAEQFIKAIQAAPAQGMTSYELRSEMRRAALVSVEVVGRTWIVEVAVPLQNSSLMARRQTAQNVFVAMSVVIVLASSLLAYKLSQAFTGRSAHKRPKA